MKHTDDNKFMQMAYFQAEKAYRKDEVPVGCVIVKNGKIIAKAYNIKERKKDATMHAEIVAIKKACKKLKRWRLSDCDIYVTLEPCTMCIGAIISARFNRLVFGAYDLKAGACGSVLNLNNGVLNHTLTIVSGIMREECSHLISDYFRKKRKEKGLANK